MTLTICRDEKRTAIKVDGKVVWQGTVGEWSRAILNPDRYVILPDYCPPPVQAILDSWDEPELPLAPCDAGC